VFTPDGLDGHAALDDQSAFIDSLGSSCCSSGRTSPYLAYVADVLPSVGEEGVQTRTVRDLVAEGASAAVEADPDVASLKASAGKGPSTAMSR
jgi:hypothetical protein